MAFGIDDAVTGVTTVMSKVIDKIWPDPTEAAKAKAILHGSEAQAELQQVQANLSAIMMEAASQDPWTSRARPSFLYVIYVFILAAIPFGILFAFMPDVAVRVTDGVKAWLGAIPNEMWWLFGAGYLGYTGGRSFDKWKASQAQGK